MDQEISPPNRCRWLITRPDEIARKDLIELESRSLDELLKDSRELYSNMREFEGKCVDATTRNLYNYTLSLYHLALLKLSTALEDKLRDSHVDDEFMQYILRYYTEDEKSTLKELEKFSVLDPHVTSPSTLADIIVAEEGEIYYLVKEAIVKGYIDLSKVLKTWESKRRIRNALIQAFTHVYQRRFRNIIDAIQLLLNQQPGWLKRLFREYEAALLESAEVRKRFEEKFNEVFERDLLRLEETLRNFEAENVKLRERLTELTTKLTMVEDEKRRRDEELIRVKSSYEELVRRYESIMADFSKKLDELESLKNQLQEKERELEELKKSQRATQAERVAMENELSRLRELIIKYEERIQYYRVLEDKVKELESALKGKATGNLVKRDEAEYLFEAIVNRVLYMLKDNEVKIFDPRTSEYKVIRRWDIVEKRYLSMDGPAAPLNLKTVLFVKLSGFLFKRKDVVIEYVFLTHFAGVRPKEFDVQPIDLSEFTMLWKEIANEAEKENCYYVLVVISPTGFSEGFINYFTGKAIQWARIASRYATVYLVDPIKGTVYYNPHDPASGNNRFLASLEPPAEQVEKVISYVISREARVRAARNNPAVNFLMDEDIIEATGVSDRVIIRRALSILEEKGVGRVRLVNNKTVFVYETT